MTSFYYLQCIAQQCTQNSLRLRLLWFPNRQICYWLPWSLFSVLGENLSFEADRESLLTRPHTHTEIKICSAIIHTANVDIGEISHTSQTFQRKSIAIYSTGKWRLSNNYAIGGMFYLFVFTSSTLNSVRIRLSCTFVCYVRCPWRLNSRRIWRNNHVLIADAVRKNKM